MTPPVPTSTEIAVMTSTRGFVVKSPRCLIPSARAWPAASAPAFGVLICFTSVFFSKGDGPGASRGGYIASRYMARKPGDLPMTRHHAVRPRMAPVQPARPDRQDYRTLSDLRYLIRRFLEFSQTAARSAGLTSRQHQALLAIKGFKRDDSPTIGDLAERLRIQHHSAVELADRLAEAGL